MKMPSKLFWRHSVPSEIHSYKSPATRFDFETCSAHVYSTKSNATNKSMYIKISLMYIEISEMCLKIISPLLILNYCPALLSGISNMFPLVQQQYFFLLVWIKYFCWKLVGLHPFGIQVSLWTGVCVQTILLFALESLAMFRKECKHTSNCILPTMYCVLPSLF